jgi:hypothetical protein
LVLQYGISEDILKDKYKEYFSIYDADSTSFIPLKDYSEEKIDDNTSIILSCPYHKDCDWRYFLYLMADDYMKFHMASDTFEKDVGKRNLKLYPTGVTGYEQYYTDALEFWSVMKNTDCLATPFKI